MDDETLRDILVQEGSNSVVRRFEDPDDEEQALIEEGFTTAILQIAERTGIGDIQDQILDRAQTSQEEVGE